MCGEEGKDPQFIGKSELNEHKETGEHGEEAPDELKILCTIRSPLK